MVIKILKLFPATFFFYKTCNHKENYVQMVNLISANEVNEL